jgi:uncharacterized protein YcbX
VPVPKDRDVVGHLRAIWRYPVKSMAATPLDEVRVDWFGISGDRRWAFIRPRLEQSGFPWLTIRQNASMGNYEPYFAEPDRPDESPTFVRTPGGACFDVTDPALAEELCEGARVIRRTAGIFDVMPLSLITEETITELEKLTGRELDAHRFRPNLLVAATSTQPFAEDKWVGSTMCIGEVRIRIDLRDARCVMINIDPTTHQREPQILRTVARARDGCLGVYGTIVTPGRIAIGDPVVLV